MSQDRTPARDMAEANSYFPSPFSLTQYVAPKTDYAGSSYSKPYTGKQKVLMIGTQERYLDMHGKFFSTGNHPVEMLLPLRHINDAGFEIDIATISGDIVKFEEWAFPSEDETVKKTREQYNKQLRSPLALSEIVDEVISPNSPYCAVFVPGGHGVLNGVPFDENVAKILTAFNEQNKFIITLCHGPACLLAPTNVKSSKKESPFKGYEIVCFPDTLDKGPNLDIGYIPNDMDWFVGESLKKIGVQIVNKEMKGSVHRDRNLLTGDSPLASNNLGKLAAETLLAEVKA